MTSSKPKGTGSSLWLVPSEDSELYKAIHNLIITKIPSLYPIALSPHFTPHVTLTANTIPSDLSEPQQWLDRLKARESSKLRVLIRELDVGEIFFQKLTMNCEKTPELCDLAEHCRAAGLNNDDDAKSWIQKNYRPHCSLM